MTVPEERTKAVRETREFLEKLHNSETEILWGLVRTMAGQLLRHYPLDVDLTASASASPGLWGPLGDAQFMNAAANRRSAAKGRAAPAAKLDERTGVVFLDIDHTLHASDAILFDGRVIAESPTSKLFEFAPIFERLLKPYPALVIILSTSWVEVLGYEFTLAQLPSDSLRARVRGATFEKKDSADDGWSALPRGTQVLRFVRRHKLKRWLAIDDMRSGFDGYEAHLIHCQPTVGLGDKDVQKLLARRLEQTFGPSASVSTPERPA
ncbi:HAD domain-containing protein [Paraburkholderia sp. USG1]|uniref:BPSL0761 family protein n=1 Tax=Paraburkholderia sp. USG1 TaxID=2952268 RepID=UPI0028669406|nr:BPSL0761 family protein [Paraburkholderia sp. USG1]MDR8401857.1 HAD domain-containing protein [Paraburkholderia sp. USG1]